MAFKASLALFFAVAAAQEVDVRDSAKQRVALAVDSHAGFQEAPLLEEEALSEKSSPNVNPGYVPVRKRGTGGEADVREDGAAALAVDAHAEPLAVRSRNLGEVDLVMEAGGEQPETNTENNARNEKLGNEKPNALLADDETKSVECDSTDRSKEDAKCRKLYASDNNLENKLYCANGKCYSKTCSIDVEEAAAKCTANCGSVDWEHPMGTECDNVSPSMKLKCDIGHGKCQACDQIKTDVEKVCDETGGCEWNNETTKCQVDPCDGVVCGNHGTCESGKCKCKDGYKGDKCETQCGAGYETECSSASGLPFPLGLIVVIIASFLA